MTILFAPIAGLGVVIAGISLAYPLCVLAAQWRWQSAGRDRGSSNACPPVSIFKPLCGAEPGLYDNLRSFCEQDYPAYEIILGVQHASDPALAIAWRLVREYPALEMTVVVDERAHGTNRKINNLQNMLAHARHDTWVFADSDAAVGPDYLRTVTAPLADPDVGLVTCPYQDIPSPNVWSRLAAMYVNDWFIPSVFLSWAMGRRDYVSGQTMCIRRGTMQAVGGLAALNNHLADDYVLGELVRRHGQSIVLSHYQPRARHDEPTLAAMIEHETRWMRTIAVLKPWSFRMLFLSFSLPLALIGLLFAASSPAALRPTAILTAAMLVARIGVHLCSRLGTQRSFTTDLWLIPVRDLLIAYVWVRALRASHLVWRGVEFRVGSDGILRAAAERPG